MENQTDGDRFFFPKRTWDLTTKVAGHLAGLGLYFLSTKNRRLGRVTPLGKGVDSFQCYVAFIESRTVLN